MGGWVCAHEGALKNHASVSAEGSTAWDWGRCAHDFGRGGALVPLCCTCGGGRAFWLGVRVDLEHSLNKQQPPVPASSTDASSSLITFNLIKAWDGSSLMPTLLLSPPPSGSQLQRYRLSNI